MGTGGGGWGVGTAVTGQYLWPELETGGGGVTMEPQIHPK